MDLDIISVLVGAASSIVAALSVYFTKRVAEKLLNERDMILKNHEGEIREIETNINDSERDIRSYLIEAINYEKSVGETLRKLNMEIEQSTHQAPDYGYDFLLKDKDGKPLYVVEVKSNKNPLSERMVKRMINKLPEDIGNALIVSKNGFTKSSFDYVKSVNKNILLASGENNELLNSISNEIKSKGITSKASGR